MSHVTDELDAALCWTWRPVRPQHTQTPFKAGEEKKLVLGLLTATLFRECSLGKRNCSPAPLRGRGRCSQPWRCSSLSAGRERG